MITSDFAAYALRVDVRFPQPVSSQVLQGRVESLLTKIALSCLKAGADLIGHIKSITETDGKGFLASSVTEHSGAVHSRGELQDGIEEAEIVINVLLYGLERHEIEEITEDLARKEMSAGGAQVRLEDLEKEHDHGHDH